MVELNKDYNTFRRNVIKKCGKEISNLSDIFFERAVFESENSLIESAEESAKFALSLANFQNESDKVYIIGFLCELNINKNNIKDAFDYYELGLKLIDKEDLDYDDKIKMFDYLKDILNGEGWKIYDE